MRQTFLNTIRRLVGTHGMREDLASIQGQLHRLAGVQQADAVPDAPSLTIMPGTPYSQVAIPLEYPPSRDLRPRWGNTRPLLQPIVDWVRAEDAAYQTVLAAMTERAPALRAIARDYSPELLPEPAWCGVPVAPFDSAALYTLIGLHKPKLYLEIGSGITTAFAWRSIQDHGLDTRIVSIDPDPRAAIDGICEQVLRVGLEVCDLEVFDTLEPGDILFMDGSHRSFMNSDVTVFMLDVLPRIKPGVLIHVHDIQLPWDYPDMFVPWYWNEAYILAAYIIGAAPRLRSVFPTAWICRDSAYESWFATPLVDLGAQNDGWRGGGSLWFTHKG